MTVGNKSMPRIAVTVGDPNGIGPEIAVRAAIALFTESGVRSLLVAEDFIIDQTKERLGVGPQACDAFDLHNAAALVPSDWQPGVVSAAAGAATVDYVRQAIKLVQSGRVSAIAAAPHSETAVNAAGIAFAGYSGLVADLTKTPRDRAFLMLEAKGLRVVHATLHESVTQAVNRLTPALVQAAAEAARDVLLRLGIAQPRLCVLGINPHAGENGLFGNEDELVTKPAVLSMKMLGWDVEGPVGADLALSEGLHDAYVAMLHDQGHIAVKMISPKGATALVAGVPLLFASVGHGAAFNLAGKGNADASAMTATLKLLSKACS
jgi:4-hydroxy-L-threonine phosphate dehydrogenase PdxA